jgi:23S rRNA (cytosine1962-C5)-methyltransferase
VREAATNDNNGLGCSHDREAWTIEQRLTSTACFDALPHTNPQSFASGARFLNLFGYTGGFSVYAGVGGAARVTTVDVAAAALKAADVNWALNGLPHGRHEGVALDAFDFLERAAAGERSSGLDAVQLATAPAAASWRCLSSPPPPVGCSLAAKESWDVVVVDPPSFAPNKAAVAKARASYERLFEMAARVTAR